MAGYVGALLDRARGRRSPRSPLCWLVVFARHRRIAYQGDWARAARRGGWIGLFVAVARRAPPGRRVPAGRSSLFLAAIFIVAEIDPLRRALSGGPRGRRPPVERPHVR